LRQSHKFVRAALLTGFALGSLSACHVPEEPEWEIVARAPLSYDTFTWIDFLPPTVDTVTAGGQLVFVLNVPQDSITYRLSRVCPACVELHGETVQIPPFDFADSIDVRFPENLAAITVQQATLRADVDNGLNFDLVGPPSQSDTLPTLVLVLRDLASGTTLDSLSLQRGGDSLPAGSRWSPVLWISDSEVVDGVRVILRVMHPGSERLVEVDTMRVAALLAKLDQTQIAEVTLVLDGATWEDDDPVWLGQQTRDEIVERFRDGEMTAVVFHDLEATGNLEISMAATRDLLFSGDPLNELRFANLDLTSGVEQTVELTLAQFEQIATNAMVMGWIMDEYSSYYGFSPGVVTGKPLELFGSPGRDEATGRGVMYVLEEALRDRGRALSGVSVALQGFGNVGSHAARLIAEGGGRIVAVADYAGGVAKKDGLDVPSLVDWAAEHRTVAGFPDADAFDGAAIIGWDADVLIPAALEGAINKENVDSVRADIVVEGANGPTTPEAAEILNARDVTVVPDIFANAGGVTVSYFEWAQNIQQFRWELDRVRAELEKKMREAYAAVRDVAKQKQLDLRTAAFVLAIERVGRAALSRRSLREEIF
jgi:hypothetical protein